MKTTKKLLAILLSVLVIFSASATAFAEGENWVKIKTSADELEKGDLYVDLASVKDAYIETFLRQNLSDYVTPLDPRWSPNDPPTFNNLEVVGLEKLANLYPEMWGEAVQQSYAEDPSSGIDGWYTIQSAFDIFFNMVKDAHPEYGLTSWSDLMEIGYSYVEEAYPNAMEQAKADAKADFAQYENAEWFYDSAFSGHRWLKAEVDGEALWYVPDDIKSSFSKYGVEWAPVAADIASAEGERGYYMNGKTIAATISDEERAAITEQGEWQFDMMKDRLPTTMPGASGEMVELTTEAELRAFIYGMVAEMIANREAMIAAQAASFFNNLTLEVNPEPDELFRLRITQTYTDYDGSTYKSASCFPLVEKAGADMPFSTEAILGCVNAYEWTWEDEDTAYLTISTVNGEEIAKIDAVVTAETTVEPKEGVAGEKLATAVATVDGVEVTAVKTFEVPALEPTTPDEPVTPDEPAKGGKIHGDGCFCYDYQGSGIIASIVRFICAFYNFIMNMRTAIGA